MFQRRCQRTSNERARNLAFEHEWEVPVIYRNETVARHRIDLFVEKKIVMEVKAIERFAPVHTAQVLNSLRLTGARVGLVINFNADQIRHGIRRIVL